MATILFDIDDTLYDQALPFCNAYRQVFGGAFRLPLEPLFIASRRHGDAVFEKSQNKEMPMEEMYRYRIQKAFEDFGITVTDEEAMEFQHAYGREQKRIALSKTMERLLDMCKDSGTAMGVITNGPSEHQWGKVEALGLGRWIPEGNIIVSGDVGYAKPDSRIFRCAEERMGLDRAAAYYIGDSFGNDMEGAQNAGWKTVWMNRRNHRLPVGGAMPDVVAVDEEGLFQEVRRLLQS